MKPRTEWKADASVAENMAEFVPPMVAEFFAEGRRLVAKGGKPRELHQFRLRVKRLRYTLELFEPVCGDPLAEVLGKLKDLQNGLGKINDCVATRSLIRHYRDVGRASRRRKVLRLIAKQQGPRIKTFLELWRDEFDSETVEEHWIQLIRPREAVVKATA